MIPMAYPVIDTNLFIRALTNDHPTRSVAAGAFLRRIERGEITVEAPVTAIADAVFVLASPRLYNLPRPQVQALLTTLVRLPHLRIASRQMVLRALVLFGHTTLDFGDCCLVAHLQEAGGTEIYSFDRDFDRIAGITRREP